jgi:tetratricopeptide (TPR) repeat protein
MYLMHGIIGDSNFFTELAQSMKRVELQYDCMRCRSGKPVGGTHAPSLKLTWLCGTSLSLAAALWPPPSPAAAQSPARLTPPPPAAADPLPGSPWESQSPKTGLQRPAHNPPALIRQPAGATGRSAVPGPAPLQFDLPAATTRPQADGEWIEPQPLPLPLELGTAPSAPDDRPEGSALASSDDAWQGLPWWGLEIDSPAELLLGDHDDRLSERLATAPPPEAAWSLTQATPTRAPNTALLGPPTATVSPDPAVAGESAAQLSANRYWTTAIDRQQAEEFQRSQVSAQLSSRILASGRLPEALPGIPSDWGGLGAASGWQAIGQELSARLSACHQLLQRGAVLSARQEALLAVERLIASLDNRIGKRITEQHWQQAMTALSEQREFIESTGLPKLSTRDLVGRHQTPLLRAQPVDELPGGRAAAYYRAYAEEQLISAGAGHPWMADLLYALGRTYEHEARLEAEQRSAEPGLLIACSFYRAAIGLAPNQSLAATQLGRLLLELDRMAEAEQVLVSGLQAGPSAAGWETLAEIYRRQGNQAGHHWAQEQLAQWPTGHSHVPTRHIHTVDPEQFARLSPPLGPPATSPGSAAFGQPGQPPRGGPAAIPASWASPGGGPVQRR